MCDFYTFKGRPVLRNANQRENGKTLMKCSAGQNVHLYHKSLMETLTDLSASFYYLGEFHTIYDDISCTLGVPQKAASIKKNASLCVMKRTFFPTIWILKVMSVMMEYGMVKLE